MNNPYLVFGVEPTADLKTIKRKYHKLSLLYHPDKAKDKEDLEQRKEMFQLISLSYERIKKERENGSFHNNEMDIDINIKEVIDNVCDMISDKWKQLAEHPLYRILGNVGVNGLMKIFERNPDKYSIMSIKCSFIDILNNAKVKGKFSRLNSQKEKEEILIDAEIIYPYVLLEGKSDYNHKLGKYTDLVLFADLTDRDDFDFDYQQKSIHIKNKEDIEMKSENLIFKTQFGDFIVK